MRPDFLRGIDGPPQMIPPDQKKPLDAGVPGYRDLAKSALARGEEEILGDLERRIDLAAKVRGTDRESQRGVFDLQVKKQQVMGRLKLDLRRLDDPKTYGSLEKGRTTPTIKYDATKNIFFRPGPKPQVVTLGEIMTGGEWGLDFYLDETVPRDIRKEYIVTKAKRELANLLDDQIIVDEANSRLTDTMKQDIYLGMAKQRETGKENIQAGVLAEKMVRNFLDRLARDFNLPIRVRRVTVYDDVEGKLDFIIEAEVHHRGVRIGKDESHVERKGIQFTIKTSQDDLAYKRYQADRARRREVGIEVDEIMVVSLNLPDATRRYQEWVDKGKPFGGPEALWPVAIKRQIIEGGLSGILPADQLRAYADQMFPSVTEAANTVPQKKAA